MQRFIVDVNDDDDPWTADSLGRAMEKHANINVTKVIELPPSIEED